MKKVTLLIGSIFYANMTFSSPHEDNTNLHTGNPILPNIGLADSHIHIYNNRLYNYATHDYSSTSTSFMMKNWWVWSSEDLVTWTFECELSPTILGFPSGFNSCWATDSQYRDGKYYWYVCDPQNTYVVYSDTPSGPWIPPLNGRPLMPGRDPSIFLDDDNSAYLITGVWNFKIAELNTDMISLRETPRRILIKNPRGPYNLDGQNMKKPTDDKPFLHKHNGKYYLSWGCYYAMSDNIYGPYEYKGCFIVPERTEDMFKQQEYGLTHDRHGSFFEWNGQNYFICNDLSSNGANKYWRNSIMGYVHYKKNGEIEPIYLNSTGVGQYDVKKGIIEAENYYKVIHGKKQEESPDLFVMYMENGRSELYYPNVHNLKLNSILNLHIATPNNLCNGYIEVWSYDKGDNKKQLLGIAELSQSSNKYVNVECQLFNNSGKHNICLVFKGNSDEIIKLDYFFFK